MHPRPAAADDDLLVNSPHKSPPPLDHPGLESEEQGYCTEASRKLLVVATHYVHLHESLEGNTYKKVKYSLTCIGRKICEMQAFGLEPLFTRRRIWIGLQIAAAFREYSSDTFDLFHHNTYERQ